MCIRDSPGASALRPASRGAAHPSQRPRRAISCHPVHRPSGRRRHRHLGRLQGGLVRQRSRRVGHRTLQDRTDSPAGAVAARRGGRVRHARLGRLVQHAAAARAHWQRAACRVRSGVLPHAAGSGAPSHGGWTHITKSPENSGRFTLQGTRLAALSIPTNLKGCLELERWSQSLGEVHAFGIEGTGSYGAGLSRSLLAKGHNVVEVTRPHRQLRYTQGKTDTLDAEGAARSVLSGQATARPKTHTGISEIIRHLKVARDTAVKSRSQAMVTLKTLIINAPADLRDVLDTIRGTVALVRHIAAFRPGEINNTMACAKAAMRALARRWLWLHVQIITHDKELERLVTARAPDMMTSHGIATLTVAEMLIVVGDDPTRIRSEAAFAKLCGVCPIPASSGKTHRSRLNRGGKRQANAALYRVAIVGMRSHEPTLAYVRKRTKDGKSKSEIIRCLKRYIVREIYSQPCVPKSAQSAA